MSSEILSAVDGASPPEAEITTALLDQAKAIEPANSFAEGVKITPYPRESAPPATPKLPSVTVLGVKILDLSIPSALVFLEALIKRPRGKTASLYFVNAHTLNLAAEDGEFRDTLNSANAVFGDGTGVRWAARLQGIRLLDNLNGTDLIPSLFLETAGKGYRYFLLGADANSIERAAAAAHERFPGWDQAGYHHGYVTAEDSPAVVDRINASGAHVLLVGMGNPLQERWIARYRERLEIPLAIGVGGLFDHWAGNLRRAPRWVRRLGFEWLQLLLQQPHKLKRYGLGNPRFLFRVAREEWRRRMAQEGTPQDKQRGRPISWEA